MKIKIEKNAEKCIGRYVVGCVLFFIEKYD